MADRDWVSSLASLKSPSRHAVTPASSGEPFSSEAAAGLNGCWLLDRITRSALTRLSSAPMNVSLSDAANTVTPVTSATPIVSAAAVWAVREGFRMAFSWPSRPARPVGPSVRR